MKAADVTRLMAALETSISCGETLVTVVRDVASIVEVGWALPARHVQQALNECEQAEHVLGTLRAELSRLRTEGQLH